MKSPWLNPRRNGNWSRLQRKKAQQRERQRLEDLRQQRLEQPEKVPPHDEPKLAEGDDPPRKTILGSVRGMFVWAVALAVFEAGRLS